MKEQLIEQIKPVKNYEGLYSISNYGYIISEARKWKTHKGGYGRKGKTILKSSIVKQKYKSVSLQKNGKLKTFMIHTLIWDHFGNSPRNGHKLQVDHKDENKLNNQIDNLQLLTPRENSIKYRKTQKTSSQFVGVHLNKKTNKWIARIKIKQTSKHLGSFSNEIDAHNAYQKALDNLPKVNECIE